jgi:hypothetical protein
LSALDGKELSADNRLGQKSSEVDGWELSVWLVGESSGLGVGDLSNDNQPSQASSGFDGWESSAGLGPLGGGLSGFNGWELELSEVSAEGLSGLDVGKLCNDSQLGQTSSEFDRWELSAVGDVLGRGLCRLGGSQLGNDNQLGQKPSGFDRWGLCVGLGRELSGLDGELSGLELPVGVKDWSGTRWIGE